MPSLRVIIFGLITEKRDSPSKYKIFTYFRCHGKILLEIFQQDSFPFLMPTSACELLILIS